MKRRTPGTTTRLDPTAAAVRRATAAGRQREAAILNSVIGWLRAVGIYAWRSNAGTLALDNRDGTKRAVTLGPVGFPDLSAVIPPRLLDRRRLVKPCVQCDGGRMLPFGVPLFVEVKRAMRAGTPRLRAAQVDRHHLLRTAGAIVLVVTSAAECREKLWEAGVAVPEIGGSA